MDAIGPASAAAKAQPDAPQPPPLDTHGVVERYKDMVYRIAVTHTRCIGDAEDVFQDVFLTYHRRQPVLHDEEHRKAWLITTTITCARRTSLSSWRTRVVPLDPGDTALTRPETQHFAADDEGAVFQALAGLPDTYRTPMHLFYLEDLPVAQIARTLDLTEAAVKMRLSRGRAQMRDQLKGGLFDE
jgi:RNA polymerase sigma-70 factor (ECF subfamily)